MDDREWLDRKDAELQAAMARDLEAARAEAARAGKEPFDYDRLCTLYDPSSDLGYGVRDPARRARELERRYYVDFPGIMDLPTFAKTLTELDTWR